MEKIGVNKFTKLNRKRTFYKGITVVIPFYNSEDTLLEAAKSLINQKKNTNVQLEVLLVDNNSSDGSSQIANALETVFPNLFKYVLCSEVGVSNARNLGLEMATMEYIMFLDADDTYSENTIQDVYQFFKKNENSIEILFYGRYFMYVQDNGSKVFKSHRRNKLFSGTGLYKEEKNKNNLYFTTLNVAIKNGISERFEPNIPYGEDMLFISNILGKNSTIGWVETAHYNYRFSSWSTINKFHSPVYSADLILDNMERQFRPYLKNGKEIPKQIQSIALNEIAWRYSSLDNKLFPYHLGVHELKNWKTRLRNLLRNIDDEIILNYPILDSFHRYAVLEMKNEPIKVAMFDTGDFRKKGVQVYEERNFETVISDFKIVDDSLYISAFLKIKLGDKIKCHAFALVNGVEEKLTMWESVSGLYKKRDKSNFFPAFNFKLNLRNIDVNEELDICFYYKIGDQIFNIKKYYHVKNRLLNIDKKSLNYKDSNEVLSENTVKNISIQWLQNFHLLVSRVDSDEAAEIFDSRTDQMPENLRLLRENWELCEKTNNIWLYVDNFNTVDNAFYQYENDYQKNDGIKRYYVYKNDFLYLGKYLSKHNINMDGMHFVLYGSEEHKNLLLNTEFILGAYNEYFATIVPFSEEELIDLSDILDFKYIYLQHGVLHAKAPQTYDVERTYIDKIVTSTDYEKDVFTNELHYDKSSLLQVGMARFDLPNISADTEKVRRILFAPSWRHNFVGDLNSFDQSGNRQINVEEFLHSQYYQSLSSIIQSNELEKFLSEHNLDFDIKLHPIFSGTLSLLQKLVGDNNHIHILKDQIIDSARYMAFVTDFSSYVFDAVASKTPIIYYELDREEFLAGNHNYRELYLGFEFGDVIDNVSTFIKTLEELDRNNYVVQHKYLEKMNSFYNFPDHPREALYKKLMEKESND